MIVFALEISSCSPRLSVDFGRMSQNQLNPKISEADVIMKVKRKVILSHSTVFETQP